MKPMQKVMVRRGIGQRQSHLRKIFTEESNSRPATCTQASMPLTHANFAPMVTACSTGKCTAVLLSHGYGSLAAPNIYGMLVAHLQQQRKSQQCGADETHGDEAASNDSSH